MNNINQTKANKEIDNNKHNNNNNKYNKHNNNKHNNKAITLQVTLFDVNNRYRPISTLINVDSIEYFNQHKKEIKIKAIQAICNKRMLSGKELVKLGYTKIKIRNYTLLKQIQKGDNK